MYLTHKQRWLRLRSKRQSSNLLSLMNEEKNSQANTKISRTTSWDPLFWKTRDQSLYSKVPTCHKKSLSTGQINLLGAPIARSILKRESYRPEHHKDLLYPLLHPHRKKVHFSTCVHVLLVPSRRDFSNEFYGEMWWSNDDIVLFRRHAFIFWQLHGRDSIQTISTLENDETSTLSNCESLLARSIPQAPTVPVENVPERTSNINEVIELANLTHDSEPIQTDSSIENTKSRENRNDCETVITECSNGNTNDMCSEIRHPSIADSSTFQSSKSDVSESNSLDVKYAIQHVYSEPLDSDVNACFLGTFNDSMCLYPSSISVHAHVGSYVPEVSISPIMTVIGTNENSVLAT